MLAILILIVLILVLPIWLVVLWKYSKQNKLVFALKQFIFCILFAGVILFLGWELDSWMDAQHDFSDGSFRLPIYTLIAGLSVLFIIPIWGIVILRKLPSPNTFVRDTTILDS